MNRLTILISTIISLIIPLMILIFPVVSLADVSVDLYTGNATYSYPIQVPPGTKGMQPNLSIVYSSGGSNGIPGLGWEIAGLGCIEKSLKNGTGVYVTPPYVINLAGVRDELVYKSADDTYHTKSEQYLRIKYDSTNKYWTVTDKSGVQYRFGYTTSSRLDDGAYNIFGWHLDRVLDTNGNYMEISYIKETNAIYPSTITYTKGNGLTAFRTVTFSYEYRSPDVIYNYMPGFQVKTQKRLKEITTAVNGTRVKKYTFNYTASPRTSRSLLTSIREYGLNDTDYFQTVFDYYGMNDTAWSQVSIYNTNEPTVPLGDSSYGTYWNVHIADMNGDGLPDVLWGQANEYCYWPSIGFDQFGAPVYMSGDPSVALSGTYGNVQLADMNGDGLPDVVWGQANDYCYWPNNGNGSFGTPVYMTGDSGIPSLTGNVQLVDMDGDGFTDVLTGSAGNYRWYKNEGGTFFNSTVVSMSNSPAYGLGFSSSNAVMMADMNGDGLPDVFRCYWDSATYTAYYYYWPNKGGTAFDTNMVTMSNPPGYPTGVWGWDFVKLVDVNGDGLPDVMNGAEGYQYQYRANLGNGTFSNQDVNMTNSPSVGLDAYNVKFTNHFGIEKYSQVMRGNASDYIYWVLDNTDQQPANFLKKVTNSKGGTSTIVYSKYNTTDEGKGKPVRTIKFTVSSITNTNGLSGTFATSAQTSYLYNGGSSSGREFRGFSTVKETYTDSSYTKSYFYQDDTYKGKLYKRENYNSGGTKLTQTDNTWTNTDLGNGIRFIYISDVFNYTYEGGTKYRKTGYAYDSYGNLSQTTEYGDDTNADKYIYNDYAYNTTNWVVGVPKASYTKASDNVTILSHSKFYYDNLAWGSVDKGNMTKKEDLITGTTWATTTFSYYANGNLYQLTDPRGYTTTKEYDATYATFLTKITNAKGHITTATYDAGVGQVLTQTDPNNQITTCVYDNFGRLSKWYGPLDSSASPTVAYTYTWDGAAPELTIKKQRSDAYGTYATFDTYTYVDGLGRTIQVKTPGEQTAWIETSTVYTNMGKIYYTTVPFGVASSDFNSAPDTTKKTSFEYDALGRVTKATNPDGTYSTKSYSLWTVTDIDEKSQKKVYYYDAYGQATKMEEYTGTNPWTLYATTDYEYDLLGRLKKIKDSAGTTDATRNITTFEYDNLGRKTSQIDPDLGTWTFAYDAVSNLTSQTDAKGYTTEYVYDELNRLTYVDYDKNYNKPYRMGDVNGNGRVDTGDSTLIQRFIAGLQTPTEIQAWVSDVNNNGQIDTGDATLVLQEIVDLQPGVRNVFYVYDTGTYGVGRLASVRNDFTSVLYTYDKMGRVLSETHKIATPSATYQTSYSFDAMGRVVNLTYPDNEVVNHTYNAQGLLEKVRSTTYALDYMNNINYNALSQVTYKKYGSTKEANLTYRTDNFRLQSIAITGLQNLTFGYDNVGNITGITDTINAGTQSFGYDSLNRLTSASSTSTPIYSHTYDYNKIGNMTSGAGKTYSYPPAASARPHAPTSDGTYTYGYDANGNLTSKTGAGNTYTYEYDYENRLIKYLLNGSTQAQYWYDYAGGRVKKDEGGTQTIYIGNIYKKVGAAVTKYYFANGERIAERDPSGNVYYYHPDHLGSSNIVTDSSGLQKKHTLFYPYGSTRTESGTKQISNKYNDKELDSSNLYYYGARYYDPGTAHFTKADNIVPNTFDPQSLNRYAYGRDNPTTMIDPTGETYEHSPYLQTNPFGGPNINYDRPDRGPKYIDINLSIPYPVPAEVYYVNGDPFRPVTIKDPSIEWYNIDKRIEITADDLTSLLFMGCEFGAAYKVTKFLQKPIIEPAGKWVSRALSPYVERIGVTNILGEPTSAAISDAVQNSIQMLIMDPMIQLVQRGKYTAENIPETLYMTAMTGITNPITNLARTPGTRLFTPLGASPTMESRIQTFIMGSVTDIGTTIGRFVLFGGGNTEQLALGTGLSRIASAYSIFRLGAYDPLKPLLEAKRINKFLKAIFSVFGVTRKDEKADNSTANITKMLNDTNLLDTNTNNNTDFR